MVMNTGSADNCELWTLKSEKMIKKKITKKRRNKRTKSQMYEWT